MPAQSLKTLAALLALALPGAGWAQSVPAIDSATAVTAFQPAGGIPQKKAAAWMRHRALTPKLSAAVQGRAQAMAVGLAGFKTLPDGPRLMPAEQLQQRHAVPQAQAAMLRRLAPTVVPPPPPAPSRPLGWYTRLKKWTVKQTMEQAALHTENFARQSAYAGLTVMTAFGLPGAATAGLYAALFPAEVGFLHHAARQMDPLTQQRIALDSLVQKGAVQPADLEKSYEGWDGRRHFETTHGLKQEPADASADPKVVAAEAVKAASGDAGFQSYLISLPQYQRQVQDQAAALQKAGVKDEWDVLRRYSAAQEIPTKDAGAKSSEYEPKLYNGRLAPLALETGHSMAALAANFIPGVSEYRMAESELQILRDPTLTKDEKAIQTARNIADTVAMVTTLALPSLPISIAASAAAGAVDLLRQAWHHRQEQKSALEDSAAPAAGAAS